MWHLGASWGRLGASWGVLGASWAVFGASWGRPETVLERLGGLLGHLGGDFIGIKQYFRGMSSWKPFFIRILVDFASKNQARKLNKSLNPIGKILFCLFLGSFNIRSLSDAILVSTWLHFSPEKHPKTRFGRFLT